MVERGGARVVIHGSLSMVGFEWSSFGTLLSTSVIHVGRAAGVA